MAGVTLEDLGFCEIELDEVEVPLLGVVQAGQPIEAVAESRTVSIPPGHAGPLPHLCPGGERRLHD